MIEMSTQTTPSPTPTVTDPAQYLPHNDQSFYSSDWSTLLTSVPPPTIHPNHHHNGGAIAKVQSVPVTSLHSTSTATPQHNGNHQQHYAAFAPPAQPAFDDLLRVCRTGRRVLVCMRGPPGSGKSTLAAHLVAAAVPDSPAHLHICGADDYFWRPGGRYMYNVHELTAAHAHCKRMVEERAAAGWSPLCVDNTNMQTWEMHDYVTIAGRHGYEVRLLEPTVPWRQSAEQLAQRNRHGVPREKIAKMLTRYQPVTVADLVRQSRVEYAMPLPQMRLQPPPPMETLEADQQQQQLIDPATGGASMSLTAQQRQFVKQQHTPQPMPWAMRSAEWPVDQPTKYRSTVVDSAHMQRAADAARQSLIDLLRIDDQTNGGSAAATAVQTGPDGGPAMPEAAAAASMVESAANTAQPLTKHRRGCRNENAAFAQIPSIYPSKAPAALWDLFERCGGDADWTMDILLTDSSAADDDATTADDAQLRCDCDRPRMPPQPPLATPPVAAKVDRAAQLLDTPSKRMSRRARRELHSTENAAVVRQLEGSVRISDVHFSSHVRTIRDLRHGGVPATEPKSDDHTKTYSTDNSDPISSGSNDDDDIDSGGDSEPIELNLSADMINQLETAFGINPMTAAVGGDGDGTAKTSVRLPKRMAQELYAVWIEGMYNDQDEERQRLILEDEEFALQLQAQQQKEADEAASLAAIAELTAADNAAATSTAHNGSHNGVVSTAGAPPVHRLNMKQIFEMECAWSDLQRAQQPNQWQQPNAAGVAANNGAGTPTDRHGTAGLAAELAKQNLCEQFPKFEPEVVADVYQMNGSNYDRTVDLLRSMRSGEELRMEDQMRMHERALMERAKMEAERLTDAADRVFAPPDALAEPPKNALEARRESMRHYEDCRNLAKHHAQMRTECYAKAKVAFNTGNTEVAVFYSRVAHLHDRKVERCQQHAAISIVDVHNMRINDPTILDLHYLFVKEAMECLDVFVDGHVSQLRARRQPHKMVMVITGRGLHSVRGISTVKIKTKARLRERGLK